MTYAINDLLETRVYILKGTWRWITTIEYIYYLCFTTIGLYTESKLTQDDEQY